MKNLFKYLLFAIFMWYLMFGCISAQRQNYNEKAKGKEPNPKVGR